MAKTSDMFADFIGGGYRCIMADPPWPYDNQATRASTRGHYETPTLEWIKMLPVADAAADQAHLHLWTTNAFLFAAREVMREWGFEFKSVFVWAKPEMGIGNYWRVSHEFMLLGVRGKARLGFAEHSFRSWMHVSRSAHSRKPDKIRRLVELVSPGPRLEMFARQQHNGWDAFGDQIERSPLFESTTQHT